MPGSRRLAHGGCALREGPDDGPPARKKRIAAMSTWLLGLVCSLFVVQFSCFCYIVD